jgi:hypothetical protein
LQKEPDWYWNFNGGMFCFDEKSSLAGQIKHGTEVVVYEDMANQELLVLRVPEKEGQDYVEEIVYKAPEWPDLGKGEDLYLWRELSKRRIAWQVTLKSKTLAEKETTTESVEEASGPSKESGEGGGMMLLGMEDYTNHLWLSVLGPALGYTNGVEISAHVPDGFTNHLEFFASTDLVEFSWTLAATNLATEGTDTVSWVEPAFADFECRFYAAGDAEVDSDGDGLTDTREKFLYHTNPELVDTDGDGVSDGSEVSNGANPNNPNDPPNVLGTVYYAGEQTNVIRVLAVTDSNSWSLTHSTALSDPGPYQIANVPGSNYWLKAFRDLDGDGVLDAVEARGEYASNPAPVTNQLTGADITLTDPDSDGDGFSDYEELYLMGTNPTNAQDGALALAAARSRIEAHWGALFTNQPAFNNPPGSQADLNDMQAALQVLATNFFVGGPADP